MDASREEEYLHAVDDDENQQTSKNRVIIYDRICVTGFPPTSMLRELYVTE